MKESNPTTLRHCTQVEASTLFEDESIDWRYCAEHATFVHSDACEFILHIYQDHEEDYHEAKIAQMLKFGCSAEFILAYQDAHDAGSSLILFYA